MLRITKVETPELLAAQLAFFKTCPPCYVPDNIQVISGTSYTYDYVLGTHPDTLNSILNVYQAMLTNWDVVGVVHTRGYLDYVYRLTLNNDESLKRRCRHAIGRNIPESLNRVRNPHGDLTLENILVHSGRVVFIDPGDTRGLPCREIDEAKLLQSLLTHWEVIKRGWPMRDLPIPFEVTPTHIALLLSHWMRLLNHPEKHSDRVLIYARYCVIPILLEVLNGDFSSGYRRCFNQLKDGCLRCIH